MIFFLRIFCFLFVGTLSAQEFEITGTVKDSSHVSLEAATVYLETVSDTSLVTYTITDRDGFFRLKGVSSAKKVNLFVSFTGFETYKKQLLLNQPKIDLGTINLAPMTNSLGEVTITATRAPVVIKSDTLQFNADSFTTQPNATLEALLKKLPGVQVDNEGNITVNGKPVNKILVNGEKFFGGDPKIATKNLPKEIIDKIQVINTKTKSEEFTGKAGDPDNKTINIELKQDMDKGYFARLTAAGGTDDRYVLNGIANYFNGDLRISALGGANNINETGFSSSELWDLMGSNAFNYSRSGNTMYFSNSGIFGRGNGITTSSSAGLNIANKWNETTELGGTYFYGQKDTDKRTELHRENILPDRRYFTNSRSSSNVVNDYHKGDLDFEIEPDTLTRISISPHFRVNTGVSSSLSSSESLDVDKNLINTSETAAFSNFHNGNFSNRLNFIRKLGGNGAYLQFHFNNNHTRSNNEQYFSSEKNSYSGISPETEIQDQFIDQERKENKYTMGLTSRSVLAKDFFLDISYDVKIENGNTLRKVFNFDQTAQTYTIFDQSLSNEFEFSSTKHIPNLGLSYEGEKWRGSFDAGLLNTRLKSTDKIENVRLKNTYNNLYLNTYLRYKLKKSSNVYLRYRSYTDNPNLQQLQPVTDRTNPLNLITGNPNLKPEVHRSFRFGLRNYDFSTRSGYFIHGSLNFMDGKVVSISSTDEDLVRHTTYANVDGNYRLRLGGSYNKRFKKEKRIFNYSFGLWGSWNNAVAFSNTERYESGNFSAAPRIRLGYEIEDVFSVSANYQLSYYFSRYEIFQNREESYANHHINVELKTYWPENVFFENEIDYGYDGNVSGSFHPTSILWNASLGYRFLDDKASIELKAYDLLNQNTSISRSTGDDYIQDTKKLILERYFLLSFTYKLTKFGGKDPNE